MKTNKILAVALSAGLVLGGASVAHAGGSSGTGAPAPVENPDALNAAKTDAIYTLMVAGKSIEEANAIVKDAKTIDELNKAVDEALNPTPDPDPEAEADKLNEAKTEAIYELMDAGIDIDRANELVKDKKTIEEVKKVVEDVKKAVSDMKENTDAEAAADKLNQAKIDAIYDLIAAGITNDFYHKQIEKAKTIEGVETLKNEILKAHAASKPAEEQDADELLPSFKKDDITPVPLTPAEPIPGKTDDYIVGGYDYTEVPVEKEAEKEIEKPVEKETKEKEAKAPKKKAAKPAKDKNANPKTGVIGLSAVAGTLAISMAGIVAARKKND